LNNFQFFEESGVKMSVSLPPLQPLAPQPANTTAGCYGKQLRELDRTARKLLPFPAISCTDAIVTICLSAINQMDGSAAQRSRPSNNYKSYN